MWITGDEGGTQPAGSWGRFARRMNNTYNNRNTRNNQSQQTSEADSIWLYVAISILYFVLIGVVLLILLLAPKYRGLPPPPPPQIFHETNHQQINSIVAETQSQHHAQDSSSTFDAKEASHVTESHNSEESFLPSPKDPIYEIDPRSSLFRGDRPNHNNWVNGKRANNIETRVNSKLLQV